MHEGSGAVVARQAHNLEVAGSTPASPIAAADLVANPREAAAAAILTPEEPPGAGESTGHGRPGVRAVGEAR